MTATTATTVITPMMTPRSVRNERSLCAVTAFQATRRSSPISMPVLSSQELFAASRPAAAFRSDDAEEREERAELVRRDRFPGNAQKLPDQHAGPEFSGTLRGVETRRRVVDLDAVSDLERTERLERSRDDLLAVREPLEDLGLQVGADPGLDRPEIDGAVLHHANYVL